jgi:predicted double-glycine peptidase
MLRVAPFKQKYGLCGPASLKMVLSFYGLKLTENKLAKLTKCNPQKGIEARSMVKAAKSLGFKAFFKDNCTLDDLKKYVLNKKIPVIVNWFDTNDGHYSAVVDIDEENIKLQDPGLGRLRALRTDNFYRVWFDFPGDFIKTKDDLILRRMIVIYQ